MKTCISAFANRPGPGRSRQAICLWTFVVSAATKVIRAEDGLYLSEPKFVPSVSLWQKKKTGKAGLAFPVFEASR